MSSAIYDFSFDSFQPTGTRFGGWLVDGGANRFGPAADDDGMAKSNCSSPVPGESAS